MRIRKRSSFFMIPSTYTRRILTCTLNHRRCEVQESIESLHTQVASVAKHTVDAALMNLDPHELRLTVEMESSSDESDPGDEGTPTRTPRRPTKAARKSSARCLKARLIKACALIKSSLPADEDRLYDEGTAPPSKTTKELFGEESARKKLARRRSWRKAPAESQEKVAEVRLRNKEEKEVTSAAAKVQRSFSGRGVNSRTCGNFVVSERGGGKPRLMTMMSMFFI
jgi:hypothetical protein